MHVRIWSMSPSGEEQVIARTRLQDGQPLIGDDITFQVDDAYLQFIVIARNWQIATNPNGGGMTVVLAVQVAQIGALPRAGASGDGGPADDGDRDGVRSSGTGGLGDHVRAEGSA